MIITTRKGLEGLYKRRPKTPLLIMRYAPCEANMNDKIVQITTISRIGAISFNEIHKGYEGSFICADIPQDTACKECTFKFKTLNKNELLAVNL